jgi:hypothetical protein
MRSFALAVAGLAAWSQALPTSNEAAAVEERQEFSIGSPGSWFGPSSNPYPVIPEQEAPGTTFEVGKRDAIFWFPDSSRSDRDNIADAELKLEIARQELQDCDDQDEKRSLKEYIKSLEKYLRKMAHITNISAPPGTTTTFTPGKRDAFGFDKLEEAFDELACQFTDKHPSLEIYLLLQHMASLLAAAGHAPSIIFLGPAESTFGISSKTKRQIFGIGGSCSKDEIVSLLLTYSSLQSIFGTNPTPQIKSLEDAILTTLKYCGSDPTTGTINPDPTNPGSPIVPDKPNPGSPIVPDKPHPGSPITPST